MEHDDVHDQATFAAYARQLRAELNDSLRAAKWENATLGHFLGAMEAWCRDLKQPAHSNPWRHAADILAAATIYE
jgi:hypothetical protein